MRKQEFISVCRNIFLIFLITFFVLGTAGSIAADYEWNKEIAVKIPVNPNGKVVLFDATHISTAGNADWVIDGGFSDFADALVAEGFTVKEYRGVDKNNDGIYTFYDDRSPENLEKNEWIIAYDAIKEADVLVLAESNRPFRQDEYAALKEFVESGKGIYFISDHYNADRNLNTWDSTETFNGYNRSISIRYDMGGAYGDMRNPQDAQKGWLAQYFGVRFRFNAIELKKGASDVRPESESESITRDVHPILIAAGATLAIIDDAKAKGIVYLSGNDRPSKWGNAVDKGLYFGGFDEGPFVAISKPGKGKAAFIGDSSPIEDDSPKYRREDGTAKKTYPGWTSPGNAAALSINIVKWLAEPEDYIGFDGVQHTKGIKTAVPLSESEKIQLGNEPWANPRNFDPWDTSTYQPGAYGAPLPAPGSNGGSSGGQNPPPTGGSRLAIILAPDYIYADQPFAAVVSSTVSNPEIGIYKQDNGQQVGQVLQDNAAWSGIGYTPLDGSGTIAVTLKAGNLDDRMIIKIRSGKKKYAKKEIQGIKNGWEVIEKEVDAEPGDIVAVEKDGQILGTACVPENKKVSIPVKTAEGIQLTIYTREGKKKDSLP